MKLSDIRKTYSGKFLHGYEIDYVREDGNRKTYEIVSRNGGISSPELLGGEVSGINMVVLVNGRLLLLKEFRLALNRFVYNMCAGMIDEGETPEEAMARELREETGLELKRIIKMFRPAYSAVAISDVSIITAVVEAVGEPAASGNEEEYIIPGLYTKQQVGQLMDTEDFGARAQLVGYAFISGMFDSYFED